MSNDSLLVQLTYHMNFLVFARKKKLKQNKVDGLNPGVSVFGLTPIVRLNAPVKRTTVYPPGRSQ